ncbi:hypothetical protein ACIQU5_28010 [Streptomyces sp. NPDC090306]|uniref:hypothetical protein n=1 Tax=Streptomyces sp. NPDC090306 TaxID=3365961 RepID=UPI00382670BC
MPDAPFTAPAQPGKFDVKAAQKSLGDTVVTMVTLSFGVPGTPPDRETAGRFMTQMREGLLTGLHACAEVERLRTGLAELRNDHRPRPRTDPSGPVALCTACSVHGSIVAWPCGAWTAAETILTAEN